MKTPVALALAGLIGVGAAGVGVTQSATSAWAYSHSAGASFAPVSYADLVDSIKGAVVSVHVTNGSTKTVELKNPKKRPESPNDSLRDFFKRFGEGGRGAPNARPSLGEGSGFIISSDGYVVTNNHVVAQASKISLTLDNGDKVDAELIGTDERTDLALLKIKSDKTFGFVKFAADKPRVGDRVLAVGNPFGLGGTVTVGIISAHGRSIGSGPYDYLQIDAAVNRGNSGGPAFNLDGEVVGINSAIYSPSGGNVGIAFAVPASIAVNVIAELRDNGSVRRGWLGVHIQNITDDIADSLAMADAHGALITKITEGGPAARSELRVGDAIVEVNGATVDSSRDLARKIAELRPDSTAEIMVLRGGKEKQLDVKLGIFPSGKKLVKVSTEPVEDEGEMLEDLGIKLARNPASDGSAGVDIREVDPSSQAALKGLRRGDRILEVSGTPVTQSSDVVDLLRKAKKKGRKAVLLRIQSGDQQRFIGLPLQNS